MMRRLSLATLVVLTLIPAVRAQDKARQDPCAINRQVISGLTRPHFGTAPVWGAAYGRPDRMIQLSASAAAEDGTVFSVGRAIDKKSFKTSEMVLVQLNRGGRPLVEKMHKVKDDERPYRIMALKDGFAVLSDVYGKGGHWARLAWYGKDGRYKSERIFREPGHDLEAAALAPAAGDRNGMVAVFHAASPKTGDEYSVVTHLSSNGATIWRRTYQPGAGNMLMDITPLGSDGYLAAGRIGGEGGRSAGWLMKLDADGAIIWQRSYARGAFAMLRRSVAVEDGFIGAGEARPMDGGLPSAWAMKVNGTGDPVWQRYYRREDAGLSALGVASLSDGRVEIMVNAVSEKGGKDPGHIRLMTLARNGMLLAETDYMRGIAARAGDFSVNGSGQRIVTASIDTGKDTQSASRYQGWAFVASPSPRYADPCGAP